MEQIYLFTYLLLKYSQLSPVKRALNTDAQQQIQTSQVLTSTSKNMGTLQLEPVSWR